MVLFVDAACRTQQRGHCQGRETFVPHRTVLIHRHTRESVHIFPGACLRRPHLCCSLQRTVHQEPCHLTAFRRGQGLAQLNTLLLQLACPETWREGSTNSTVGKSGGKAARGVAENKLSKKSARHNPYGSQCELCKAVLHQQQAKYCHTCAYSKGAPASFPSHLLGSCQLTDQRVGVGMCGTGVVLAADCHAGFVLVLYAEEQLALRGLKRMRRGSTTWYRGASQ